MGDVEVTAQVSSHKPNSFVVHLGILLCITDTSACSVSAGLLKAV